MEILNLYEIVDILDHDIFGFSTEVFCILYTFFGNEHLLTTPLLLAYNINLLS
jgi:hypothetical protein